MTIIDDTFGWCNANNSFESEWASDISELPSNVLLKISYIESPFLERTFFSWSRKYNCHTLSKKAYTKEEKEKRGGWRRRSWTPNWQHTLRNLWTAWCSSVGYFLLKTFKIFFTQSPNKPSQSLSEIKEKKNLNNCREEMYRKLIEPQARKAHKVKNGRTWKKFHDIWIKKIWQGNLKGEYAYMPKLID